MMYASIKKEGVFYRNIGEKNVINDNDNLYQLKSQRISTI